MKMEMEEKGSLTKKLSKTLFINNDTKLEKERNKSLLREANEIFGDGGLPNLPPTINYNSDILPDAIFLTTSSGELITTPTMKPVTSSHNKNIEETTTTSSALTRVMMNSDNKTERKKEEKTHITSDVVAPASNDSQKPSALIQRTTTTTTTTSTTTTNDDLKSSATENDEGFISPTSPQSILSSATSPTTKQQITSFTTTNFPLISSGLTGFTGATGFSTSQTNFAAFTLPNPLLSPGLTIPLYSSLVAVSSTAKDTILPALAKDIFPPVHVNRMKGHSKSKNTFPQNGMTTTRGRKRTAQSRLPAKLKEPEAVERRNARERRRVKLVNDGFLKLRRHVPTDPKNKKLSKVKTLRLAIEYIHHLQDLLQTDTKQSNVSAATIVSNFTQHVANSFDDLETTPGNGWLPSDGLTRVNRDMDEDIFQTIDPARLRTTYTEYITR